ncbi:hypothetical protein pb186bvf_016723 [Paramecium bursaria]
MYKSISKLSIKKKTQFQSEEEDADTPLSTQNSLKKGDFQTDDSDVGTPLNIQKGPQVLKHSKFKQQQSKQHLSNVGRHIVYNKQTHSDAEPIKQQSKQYDRVKSHPFRHLIFSDSTDEATLRKHLLVTQRGLAYASKCLKGPSDKFIQLKEVPVPLEDYTKKLLILDLDETLVHTCSQKDNPQVLIKANDSTMIGVNLRPHLQQFLDTLKNYYQIFVFTASSPAYATAIIDFIDPNQHSILGIFTRGHCMETKNGFMIKDLRILKDINLKDVIIVDNLSHSFGLQIDNGVPILEWQNDPKDQELKFLAEYLIEASFQNDIREYNRKQLRLRELIDFNLE